jgi:hypothetical protein
MVGFKWRPEPDVWDQTQFCSPRRRPEALRPVFKPFHLTRARFECLGMLGRASTRSEAFYLRAFLVAGLATTAGLGLLVMTAAPKRVPPGPAPSSVRESIE